MTFFQGRGRQHCLWNDVGSHKVPGAVWKLDGAGMGTESGLQSWWGPGWERREGWQAGLGMAGFPAAAEGATTTSSCCPPARGQRGGLLVLLAVSL